jgi:hypothetical protein
MHLTQHFNIFKEIMLSLNKVKVYFFEVCMPSNSELNGGF